VVRERPRVVEGEREGFTVLQLSRTERPGIGGDRVRDLTLVRPANRRARRDIELARLEIEVDDVHKGGAGGTDRVWIGGADALCPQRGRCTSDEGTHERGQRQ
jgi:hypothetical protein